MTVSNRGRNNFAEQDDVVVVVGVVAEGFVGGVSVP